MTTSMRWIALATAAVVGTVLAGCAKQDGAASREPVVIEKTFALVPANARLKTAALNGGLMDLKVFERVEKDTGRIVDAPRLQGKLHLKNVSSDQAIRLVEGHIEYMDASGRPIALAKDRQDTSFKFSSWQADRLDPGMEATYDVDVPFPIGELTAKSLADVRLGVTYTDIPYRRDVVVIPLSFAATTATAR